MTPEQIKELQDIRDQFKDYKISPSALNAKVIDQCVQTIVLLLDIIELQSQQFEEEVNKRVEQARKDWWNS